jgi:hypothetical protein
MRWEHAFPPWVLPRACGCMLALDKHSPTRNNIQTHYKTFKTHSLTFKHLQTHSTTFNVTIHLAGTTTIPTPIRRRNAHSSHLGVKNCRSCKVEVFTCACCLNMMCLVV